MCQGAKPAIVTLIGNVIVGMFLVLPRDKNNNSNNNNNNNNNINNNDDNNNDNNLSLQQQGAIVFKAILYEESELCIPHIQRGNRATEGDITSQRRRVAAVELLGALVGTINCLKCIKY